MLSEDEKKLLKIFKAQVEKEETEYFSVNVYTQLLYDSHKTVLNIIEKLEKENEVLKRALDKETADRSNDLLELQKKDKMIDLIINTVYKRFKTELVLEYGFENEEQFKQCFERRVEDETI